MNKFIIPIIEAIALLFAMVFGGLWLYYPDAPYEPPFAVSCFVLVIADLMRRYGGGLFKKKEIFTEIFIDTKNTLVARYLSSGSLKSGNMCIVFYNIKVINSSEEALTVKEVILRYQLNDTTYCADSSVVVTGTMHSPLDKKDINCLIVHRSVDQIVLMGWDNLRSEINKYNTLPAAGVLSGSAVFVLETDNLKCVSEIRNVEIIITDYSGNESVHPIDIIDEWLTNGINSVIEPKNFTRDDSGKITYT